MQSLCEGRKTQYCLCVCVDMFLLPGGDENGKLHPCGDEVLRGDQNHSPHEFWRLILGGDGVVGLALGPKCELSLY